MHTSPPLSQRLLGNTRNRAFNDCAPINKNDIYLAMQRVLRASSFTIDAGGELIVKV